MVMDDGCNDPLGLQKAAQPKSTTAASRPSLSPKWWYRVGAVTPAASQMARVETSPSADKEER